MVSPVSSLALELPLGGTHSDQLSTLKMEKLRSQERKGHARDSGAGQGRDLVCQYPGHAFSCSQAPFCPKLPTFLGCTRIYSVMPSFSLVFCILHSTKRCLCVVVLIKFYFLLVKKKANRRGMSGCGFSVSPACEEPIWIVELKMNSLLPPWWPLLKLQAKYLW